MLLWINGRTEHQYKLAAWQTAHVLNCWSKRRIKPTDLVQFPGDKKKMSIDDFATPEDFLRAVGSEGDK